MMRQSVLALLMFMSAIATQGTATDPEGPRFLMEPLSRIDFSNNTGVRMDCIATGNPHPTIEWLRSDNTPVTSLRHLRHVFPNGTLVLSPFKAEDYTQDVHAVIYKCRASNSVGTIVSRNVRVRAVVLQNYEVQVYDEFVIAGNTAVMKCQIPSFVADYVRVTSWLRDSSFNILPSEEFDGKYLMLPSGELQIHDVKPSDAFSTYRCSTVHQLTKDTRTSATGGRLFVTVPHGSVPPRITDNKMTVTVPQGGTAILPCNAQAFPLPSNKWFIKGEDGTFVSIAGKDKRIVHVMGNLILKNVDIHDAGVYVCQIGNPVGTERLEVQFKVTAPLSVHLQPRKLQVDFDQQATLQCITSGFPLTSLIWLKDGRVLTSSESVTVSHDVLHIHSISKSHRGMYQCIISNEEDSVQTSTEITLGDIPANIVRISKEETVPPGHKVALQCIASGSPLPIVKWTLDDQPLPLSERFHVTAFTNDEGNVVCQLNISQIRTEEGGKYTCVASNKLRTKEESTRINVYGRPFVRTMQKKSVVAGKTVIIHCPYSGYPVTSISWEKGGVRLPVNHLQVVFPNGTLKLLSVQRADDAGAYTCIVRNKHGQRAQSDLELTVLVPPRINPTSFQDTRLHEGAHARLICAVVEGDLPITFTWLKEGSAISAAELGLAIRDFDEFSSVLTISKAAQKHSGNYTCVATNAAATDTCTAQITVNVPPQIIPFSFQDGFLNENTLTRVACVVSQGDLPLTFLWIKDSDRLPPDLEVLVRNFDEYSSVLTINKVSTRHNGNYTCVVENSAGSANFSAQLTVKVPPRWKVQPIDVTATPGVSLKIDCKASGFPDPHIEWLKAVEGAPGEYEPLPLSDHAFQIQPNGSLVMSNVHETHEGRYLCRANNGVGNGLSKVITIDVRVPVKFDVKVRNKTVIRGEDAKLSCTALGDSPIRIKWLRNEERILITSDSRFKVQENVIDKGLVSNLTIKRSHRKDNTVFYCAAENNFGKDEMLIHLIVIESPESPKNLMLLDHSSRSVKLSWISPFDGNNPIIRFLVSIKNAADSWDKSPHNITVKKDETTVIVTDLQPATAYNARVFAMNEAGFSEPSEKISFTTLEDAPGGAPLIITAEATGNEAVKITWKPPKKELWNGIIQGYYVGYKVHESPDPYSFLTVQAGDATAEEMSLHLENLRHFTKYNVIVQAFNHIGSGPRSDEVIVLTSESVPSFPPENVRCTPLSSQSIKVDWEPLSPFALNGVLQGYKIVYVPENEWYEDADVETKTTSATGTVISGLQKFTNYSVQVLAFTRKGDGVRSDVVICNTMEDVPEAPADIKAVAVSMETVLVSWRPPHRANGVLKRYTVYMRGLPQGKEEIAKHFVPPPEVQFEVTNLERKHRYEFWVTASTSVGEGHSTSVVSLSTTGVVVPAKIVSFGSQIYAPWRTNLDLPCKAVGVPFPTTSWRFQGTSGETKMLSNILPDGTLQIPEAQPADNGNYTCSVSNTYGSDDISYSVFVQVPPPAPLLIVSSATYNSLEVRWEKNKHYRVPISGYYLFYKKEFGEWEEVFLDHEYDRYLITRLECGSKYQVYVAAVNKLGIGPSSSTISAKTKGSAPVHPKKEDFINEDKTSVILYLDTWSSGGCPILYFVVQYKPISQDKWRLVSNNVLLQQREFVIPDLPSATWFALQVTAHNNAGSTVAGYEFATLNTIGGTIAPLASADRSVLQVSFFYDLRVIVPALSCIIALMIMGVITFICYKRKNIQQLTAASDDKKPWDPDKTKFDKNYRFGSFTYVVGDNNEVAIKGSATEFPNIGNVSPYATTQIANYESEMTTFGQDKHLQLYSQADKENCEGTFPRTKKPCKQETQHCQRPNSVYMPVSTDIIPQDSSNSAYYNSQSWLLRISSAGACDQRVPDILDHGPESTSSNETSPELQTTDHSLNRTPSAVNKYQIKGPLYNDLRLNQNKEETTFTFENSDPKDDGYEEEDLSDFDGDKDYYKKDIANFDGSQITKRTPQSYFNDI